ncbi:MAG: ribulose-bisphosphate carboxylase large subunit family protein [Alcaligenes sp.]
MSTDTFLARYLIETPLAPEQVAQVIAGEQSCGTFTRVAGETDELRERARATVERVQRLESVPQPSLSNALLERRGTQGPYHRAWVDIRFPIDNIGANLPTLAACVTGNLFDLGEVTGLRLEALELPAHYRRRFDKPSLGIAGTRSRVGVAHNAMVGTIIKPSVGLRTADVVQLVQTLCDAGVDFIKDDEVCADPAHSPLHERIPAVMAVIRDHEQRTGKHVMFAFNISDETDAMKRHADLVEQEGGSCVMVSQNWVGYSALQTLRRHTDLALHAHRNGYGALSRHPLLGISVCAYQTLWRLAGADHIHVHGLDGKFAQPDQEVREAIAHCLNRLDDQSDDRVLPVVSSGQWAGTVPATWQAAGSTDVLFMAGGGILAHPGGAHAGVLSLQQAWQAADQGISLQDQAKSCSELAQALEFFGPKMA